MESPVSQFTALQITRGETNTKFTFLILVCGSLNSNFRQGGSRWWREQHGAERPGLCFWAPASVPRAQRSPCRSHHPAPAAAGTLYPLLLAWLCLAGWLGASRGCQLPSEGRPLSEGCHPKQAEITVYTEVLALYQDGHGSYRLPWQYAGLLHGAQVRQSGAACSRLKLTGQIGRAHV